MNATDSVAGQDNSHEAAPGCFNEHQVIHDLKHNLPAQASLKDFIHHNTLHAFQNKKFYEGIRSASYIFGYKVSLTLNEYRELYKTGKIKKEALEQVISQRKGAENLAEWTNKLVTTPYVNETSPRIGALRSKWKRHYKIDLDSLVHPTLFRILCSYLDQGIAMWNFPVWNQGFLASIIELEKNTFTSFFRTERAKKLLRRTNSNIEDLLKILIGDEQLYKQYLFDQQFAHQGWSGMVSVIEDMPEVLLDQRKISLSDVITLELLMEIDALDYQFGEIWAPLGSKIKHKPVELFAPVPMSEMDEVLTLWQDAYEWTYYDEVLAGIKMQKLEKENIASKSFQALFCIDDRECSIRRHLEKLDASCETYGTPGFFTVEFYFQAENGKFITKVCPAPVTPKFLVKETGSTAKRKTDVHFTKQTHTFLGGWFISQTIGFWSAFKLMLNIFRPAMSPATASSFRHMDKVSSLTVVNKSPDDKEFGLQVGFNLEEMTNRVQLLLSSIGLIKDYAPLVYLIGHGSSSVNNPHYAAYDCGACSGRPGSVNARVASYMANLPEVREQLKLRGIDIPSATQFIGGLHDTAADDVQFYDENILSAENTVLHEKNKKIFTRALDENGKERSRRFESIDSTGEAKSVHDKVRRRTVSLFEPRPELNHATNSLCIVAGRALTKHLFLDRRAFLNSYDYKTDLEGKLLLGIMKPLGPVCGGINLEYFFSRVDNQKLGAGTKLPHNVMGLFAVANGADGDLRPGLPSQMIEVHDPIRLLLIVEHFPEVVLKTIQTLPEMYEWYINDWVHLVVINPETHELFRFKDGGFTPYQPLTKKIEAVTDLTPVLESTMENLPVYTI